MFKAKKHLISIHGSSVVDHRGIVIKTYHTLPGGIEAKSIVVEGLSLSSLFIEFKLNGKKHIVLNCQITIEEMQ